PFIDRVRELYERHGVSTILVMGGSGDYFDVADTVIMMREYLPADVTTQAKAIAERLQTNRKVERPAPFQGVTQRIPLPHSFDASRGKREVKIDVRGLETLLFGSETVDLRHVEQLVDPSQTRAVGYAIYLAARRIMDGRRPLAEVLDELETFLEQEGLDALAPFRRGEEHPGNFALPRRYEIAAAINRLRSLRVQQK
ncbi:MAG TPA: ATPase, partial [Bacteroidetes bacterium]|nr:ATPase [Bacteroidota bacterium]